MSWYGTLESIYPSQNKYKNRVAINIFKKKKKRKGETDASDCLVHFHKIF